MTRDATASAAYAGARAAGAWLQPTTSGRRRGCGARPLPALQRPEAPLEGALVVLEDDMML